MLVLLVIQLSLDYTIDRCPRLTEIKEIAKRWNEDDPFWLYFYVEVSIVFHLITIQISSRFPGMVFLSANS